MTGPRVLQALAGAHHGGAENFFVRLCGALHRAGLPQRVVIRRDADRAAALRALGIEPAEVRFGGWFDFSTGPALRRLIREWRPQIVLTWMNRASASMPRGDFVHVGRLGGYYDVKYYRHCHQLIALTPDIIEHLVRQGWPRERIQHITNFVDATPADPVDRATLATPPDVPLVFACGRLHRNKAFDILIRALADVPRAILWLAGDGPERAALERLAADAGVADRIRFLGWRDDLPALYRAADLFVCPSRHEPFGSIVPEAWAHGAPMVAAAAQGPAAMITDGVDGLLVPIDDAPAMAAAMRAALDDPALRARLAAAGRVTHAARYSEPAVVAQYLSFFDRIAA